MIEVYDDFLGLREFADLQEYYTGDNCDWKLNPRIVFPWDEDTLDNYQFTHTIFRNYELMAEEGWKYVGPVLGKLTDGTKHPVKVVLRVKANLRTRTTEIQPSSYHQDYADVFGDTKIPYYSAIYYVNSNDGYTEFKTGEKIESVANRLLLFSGDQDHRGTSCTNAKQRIVINFNYV
tara:strand:+ start:755 stop:1285 length:531 start_codon:yes stop_codon:yes gene_type:complete